MGFLIWIGLMVALCAVAEKFGEDMAKGIYIGAAIMTAIGMIAMGAL